MLRSEDSWIAVASAIVTARSGIPLPVPTAEMVAALTAITALSSYVSAGSSAERTTHREPAGAPPRCCAAKYPASASSTTRAAPTRSTRPRRKKEGSDTLPKVLEGAQGVPGRPAGPR